MKTAEKCTKCFIRQVVDACNFLNIEPDKKETLQKIISEKVAEFPATCSPVEMARTIHKTLREVTGCNDPYQQMKDNSNRLCKQIQPVLAQTVRESNTRFADAVKLAIAGNIIDAGAFTAESLSDDNIKKMIGSTLSRETIGNTVSELKTKIANASQILYIGDNTGECFFDHELLQLLPQGKVIYAVRGEPVINDATRTDALEAGIDSICPIIDTGDCTPGVLLKYSSGKFKRVYEDSDLIIAKGQGNYESLSDFNDRDYAFLLKVKCDVLAEDIGYPQGSNVIKINNKGN